MLQPVWAARVTRTSMPLGKGVDLTALAIKIVYPSIRTTETVGGQVLLNSCCGGTGCTYTLMEDEFLFLQPLTCHAIL